MRKRYRVLAFASIVAAVVVPVGFALSLETTSVTSTFPRSTKIASSVVVGAAPVVGKTSGERAGGSVVPLPDAAKLLFVGWALFGLASALRRGGSRRDP